jgi:hypothetical protein
MIGMTNNRNPASDWAAKVDKAANDPKRIEKRKDIPPAFEVPRKRPV